MHISDFFLVHNWEGTVAIITILLEMINEVSISGEIKGNGLKTKPYGVIIAQQSLEHPFIIFPFKRRKNAERPTVTKQDNYI